MPNQSHPANDHPRPPRSSSSAPRVAAITARELNAIHRDWIKARPALERIRAQHPEAYQALKRLGTVHIRRLLELAIGRQLSPDEPLDRIAG